MINFPVNKLPATPGDAGQPVMPTREAWNAVAQQGQRANNVSAEFPLTVTQGVNGAHIRLDLVPLEIRTCVITGCPTARAGGNTNFVGGGYIFNTGGATQRAYSFQETVVWTADGTEDYVGDGNANIATNGLLAGNLWNSTNTSGGANLANGTLAYEINGNPCVSTNSTQSVMMMKSVDQCGVPVYLFQAPAPILIEAILTSYAFGEGTGSASLSYYALGGYGWQQVFKTDAPGVNAWGTQTGGLDSSMGYAYNRREETWPSSVGGTAQLANLPPGFTYGTVWSGPGTSGTRTQLTLIPTTNGTSGYRIEFSEPNPILGFCT